MLEKKFFETHCDILQRYLDQISSVSIVYLDQDFIIRDCNQVFMKLIGRVGHCNGVAFRDLLLPESFEALLTLPGNGNQATRLILDSRLGVPYALTCFLFRTQTEYLLFGEKAISSDDTIIEKITNMNNELSNMTRDLNKKNVALEKANTTITNVSRVDSLTSIANRGYFLEMYKIAYAMAKRHHHPLSLVMVDLDYFKQVNDTYGHQIGDQVLERFAKLLQDQCRSEDLPARLGGDEFIVLLTQTNTSEALSFAERIRTSIKQIHLPNQQHQLTASFGVASLVYNEPMYDLLKRVDEALYSAKRAGRNRIKQ